MGKGATAKRITVPNAETNECPVSLITPQSITLARAVDNDHLAKEASGACMYGTDSSQWPGRWFDAITAIEEQRKLIEAAIHG